MTACMLTIDFKTYWHAGGGRGGGAVLDAVAHRDSAGLPVVPGRHLKGLLRDALERASLWGWFDDLPDGQSLAAALFGERTETTDTARAPTPGSLRVGDATLPTELAAWLAREDAGAGLRGLLFRPLHQTAVEHATGSARDGSLRGIEATVPLTLAARIEPIPGRQAPPAWPELLPRALPLIDALGAHRTRGLGRATLSLEKIA